VSKPVVLKVFRNGGVVDVKQFTAEQQIVFGSSPTDTQIVLQGQVSPFHASIEKRGDRYILSDLGSTQGTFLKGSKILESGLEHGDKIAIGEYIIEFYIGAPTVVASQAAAAPVAHVKPVEKAEVKAAAPVAATTVAATQMSPGGTVGVGAPLRKKVRGQKTIPPESTYKNLSEFIKPTKGSTVEVLVAWRERVINAYHFHQKGTVTYGSHPSCDVVVPSLTTQVNKAPLLQIDGAVSVFIPAGMAGTFVIDNNAVPLSQLYNQGRLQAAGGGSKLNLAQGEMVRISLGSEVELVVRYCSETPKPLFIPMIDFASNGFLATLLAIILSVVVSLYVALNKTDKNAEEEDEYRTALIIENPPPPPPVTPMPKIEEVKPPEKKIEEPPKKVKQMDKPAEKKAEAPKTPEKREPVKQASKAGGGNGSPAQSMKANPNKPKSNQVGSVKQGGSVKTANKDGAQAESATKDPSKSGIFGVFGSGGKQAKLDNTYSGKGELAGLADSATGQSGFGEDRPGEGLGSKFKETGGGNGKSNIGVQGISNGKGLGMGSGGFGGVGLGGKGSVTVLPGGDGESYGGNIDRAGIRQVFINNQRVLQSCYEKALGQDRGLSGKLVLDFDIGEQGRVLRASVSSDKSTLNNSELATCVVNRMKGWRFPEPPQNQTVQVFYPLAFSGK
jgi:pSer/pThr/pTyr-binding forkhead associated (FHA) protein/outer membrane biosynthesis protein TonB